MRLIAFLTALLLPVSADAACTGQDIRPDLAPEIRAEIAAAAEAELYGEGNFWRATRDDQTLTLIGTVHLDDPRLAPIVAGLSEEIAAADILYLEMTATEQAQLETDITSRPEMVLLQNRSLIDLLPDDVWLNLKAAAEARGLPGPAAARMQPWYLSLVLALPPCLLASGAVDAGLDAQLEAVADANGTATAPLEPYDTLFAIFADEPLETQIRFLSASIMDDQTAEDMLATTLNTYFEEAPAALWHLSRIAARDQISLPMAEIDALFGDLEIALLTERNRAWVDLLADAPERDIVAAFGAAHLFGTEGVLNLLQGAGYTLERIAP